jgi:tol-pal system protein YbgF
MHARALSLRPLMVAVICLALPACAHVQGGTYGRPDEAGGELSRLRQDHAQLRQRVRELEKRIAQLEVGGSPEPTAAGDAAGVALASAGTTPPAGAVTPAGRKRDPFGRDLPVVKLEPKGAEGAEHGTRLRHTRTLTAATDPTIEAETGWDSSAARAPDERDTALSEPASAGSTSAGDQVAAYRLVGSRLVRLTTANPVRPDRPPRGKKGNAIIAEYEAAMDLYRSGESEAAAERFAAFVSTYPKHDYADNALYWQGESSYDQGHYSDALSLFTEVVERFGGGNKAPDALLKIGLCYARLGDEANARDVLTQLVAAYPKADATRIAESKLADMTGEQP